MLQMEINLAKFAKALGKDDKQYRKAAAARKEAINTLMWNKEDGESFSIPASKGQDPSPHRYEIEAMYFDNLQILKHPDFSSALLI